MGTPNFARPSNASEYFVVGTNTEEEYKECEECNHRHYAYEYNLDTLTECENGCENPTFEENSETHYPEEYEIEDIQENLNTELSSLGYPTVEASVGSNRNYGLTGLKELYVSKQYGDVEVKVEVTTVMQSAYYEGATLDWLVTIDGVDYMTGSSYDSDLDSILDDLFDYEYNSDMSAGLCKIMKGYAETWIEQQISDISEKVEKVFKTYSEHRLHCKGVFSNGEAVYETVK